MTVPRRRFLVLAASAAVLPCSARIAPGQSYPSRPVRLMVGFAAGQAIDVLARLVGQWLSDRLGQQFIVENRPGAGGNLVTEAVVRASQPITLKNGFDFMPNLVGMGADWSSINGMAPGCRRRIRWI